MKKIFAILSLVTASSAFAQSINIDRQNTNPETGTNSQQIGLSVKAPINKLLSIDAGVQWQQAETTQKVTARAEAGLSAQTTVVGPIDAYGRLAVGMKAPSGTEAFSYHSEEVGISYRTPITGLVARIGHRYRTAFEDGRGDTSNTTRYNVSYALTKNDTVGVRYDDTHGDGAGTSTALFYSRKF
jgi:hypothetical protein